MIRSRNVLLVEDNPMDAELAVDAFRHSGLPCAVRVCSSGEAAIDYLGLLDEATDRVDHPLPDLVLLDLKLPGLDGHEVLRRIRSAPVLRWTPVIVLTSSREAGDRALSYELGVNSYLVKPVSYDEFLDMIRDVRHYWLDLNVGPPETADQPLSS